MSSTKQVKLRGEFGLGFVSAWPLQSPNISVDLPDGTIGEVYGQPSLNGYVVVFIDGEAFEVWYENLSNNALVN